MTSLQQVFKYDGCEVRTVAIKGEPWFVAKDVADILGYTWYGTSTIRHVPEEWRGVDSVPTPFGNQEMVLLSEQGLYFFLARSDKPTALPFQKWIAGEVVPSIRKTGAYSVAPTFHIPQTYAEALRLAADQQDQLEAQKAALQLMAPKAEFHDAVASSGDAQSIRDVAKLLGTGQNRLFRWLRHERNLMADNRPYQRFIDEGYFRVIEQTWENSAGEVHLSPKTLVTGKGLVWLQKRWVAKDHAKIIAFPGAVGAE